MTSRRVGGRETTRGDARWSCSTIASQITFEWKTRSAPAERDVLPIRDVWRDGGIDHGGRKAKNIRPTIKAIVCERAGASGWRAPQVREEGQEGLEKRCHAFDLLEENLGGSQGEFFKGYVEDGSLSECAGRGDWFHYRAVLGMTRSRQEKHMEESK